LTRRLAHLFQLNTFLSKNSAAHGHADDAASGLVDGQQPRAFVVREQRTRVNVQQLPVVEPLAGGEVGVDVACDGLKLDGRDAHRRRYVVGPG
jgi:hypothetical protein